MVKTISNNIHEAILKKKKLFAKSFLPALVFALFAVSGLTLTSTFAAQTTIWDGNGTTTTGLCANSTPDATVPAGQQQWLFILTSPDAGPWTLTATFNPATTPSPAVVSGVQQGGGSIHFVVNTAIGAQLVSATASNGTENSVLTVSHCEYHQQLQVSKTANTTFTRSWAWTIDKTCDQTQLTLAINEQFTVNCSVSVNSSSTDSNWAANGTITIHNPDATTSATITGVTDVITGPVNVTPNCGVTFPYILTAGSTLSCTYSTALSDATSRTNTATVTTSGAIAGNTGTAPVTFSSTPSTETDECITVNDDKYGSLGTACANETLPKVFNYTQSLQYATCGQRQFVNTASFLTNDTSATGSDNWTVNVTVPCVGCTLTQGYWKTHNASFHGGAPADNTWAQLGAAKENTTFFSSGQSWYQVFWTNPAGNVYYQLADQYMAARLNQLNGAAVPANVQAALNTATGLFGTYTPANVAALKGNSTVRAQFVTLAGILGSYNEGLIGPGHCSE